MQSEELNILSAIAKDYPLLVVGWNILIAIVGFFGVKEWIQKKQNMKLDHERSAFQTIISERKEEKKQITILMGELSEMRKTIHEMQEDLLSVKLREKENEKKIEELTQENKALRKKLSKHEGE